MECTIDTDDFINMVQARIENYWKYNIEDYEPAWTVLCDYIREYGTGGHSVMYIADNFIVNGSYGYFDEFKDKGQSDEDFIAWLDDNAIWYDTDKRYCVISLM